MPRPSGPSGSGGTYRVLELLADGADDRQRLLQLGGQLVGIHVPQTQHVTHLERIENQSVHTQHVTHGEEPVVNH